MDIEDFGIVFGQKIVCPSHGWAFDVSNGKSENSRYILDVYDVKVLDDKVYVSIKPSNELEIGVRRDFGGVETE